MKSNFQKIIKGEKSVLVNFYADWSETCKTLTPILEDAKEELGDTIKIVKINVDNNQMLAFEHQIVDLPTLILFEEGEQVWRKSEVGSKSELVQLIKAHQTDE